MHMCIVKNRRPFPCAVLYILASHTPHLPRQGHSFILSNCKKAESVGFEPTEQLSSPASLAMRCFRPLSQLSNSTLSHDRVEQCLTKNFYNNICRCINLSMVNYIRYNAFAKHHLFTSAIHTFIY